VAFGGAELGEFDLHGIGLAIAIAAPAEAGDDFLDTLFPRQKILHRLTVEAIALDLSPLMHSALLAESAHLSAQG